MPRELTHWIVVDEALKRSKTSAVAAAVQSHLPITYLGAMTPDVPYYYQFGGSKFEEVAERVHGANGEDTLEPVRRMAEGGGRDSASNLAFWAGFVSHIATDSVFHPMVYFFTGDYYSDNLVERRNARTAHRLFEVYLDSFLGLERSRGELTLFRTLLNQAASEVRSAERQLSSALGYGADVWHRGFKDMALCQAAFLSEGFGFLLRAFSTLGYFSAIDALCSYGRHRRLNIFQSSLNFRCPVSGEERRTTIDELVEDSVAETIALWEVLERIVNGDQAREVIGKSLNTGKVHTTKGDMKYFLPISERGGIFD